MGVLSNDYVGCQGTNADAGNGLQGVFKIGTSLTFLEAELLLYQFKYGLSATYMACGASAYPDNLFPAGGSVELFIEGDHPLYLCWEKAGTSGYELYCLGGNISAFLLDILKQGD